MKTMNTLRNIFFSALLILSAQPLLAQSSKIATTAAPFLTLGTGARASALGHAFTSKATGADALFWNPSGIAVADPRFNDKGSFLLTNYEWVADIGYNAFGVTLPVNANGVLGLSFAMVDYGTMDVTTIDMQEGTGEKFSPRDMVVGLSYAQPLTNQFYIGGTVKYIQQQIWDMQAQTVALDIGFMLITEYWNGIRLGASLSNFGGEMQLDGVNSQTFIDPDPNYGSNTEQVPVRYYMDEWPIPVQFKFGLGIPVIVSRFVEWEVLLESHQTNDQYLNADMGSELRFKTNSTHLALRAGYKDMPLSRDFHLNHVDSHWSFGFGIETQFTNSFRIGVDGAYVPFTNLGNVRMIDFRIYF